MSLDNLEALLVEQLQDIYYAEKQLVKALPKMARSAKTADLKNAFTAHTDETEEHVSRLEQVFEALGVPAKAKKCPAIEGLIQEAAEMMDEEGDANVLDAGLIASAQRVEHYEIAAYGNARTFAEALGHTDVMELIDATLGEEHAADRLLTEITSETVLPAALAAGEAEESDEEEGEESEGEDSESATPARRKTKSAKSGSTRKTR
jgi:ferritin-like metal-binding protein YciE